MKWSNTSVARWCKKFARGKMSLGDASSWAWSKECNIPTNHHKSKKLYLLSQINSSYCRYLRRIRSYHSKTISENKENKCTVGTPC